MKSVIQVLAVAFILLLTAFPKAEAVTLDELINNPELFKVLTTISMPPSGSSYQQFDSYLKKRNEIEKFVLEQVLLYKGPMKNSPNYSECVKIGLDFVEMHGTLAAKSYSKAFKRGGRLGMLVYRKTIESTVNTCMRIIDSLRGLGDYIPW